MPRLSPLLLLAPLLTACAPAHLGTPAPLATRVTELRTTHARWQLPDTIPDTTTRQFVAEDLTGDSVPDLAILMVNGPRGRILFFEGQGPGAYYAPQEIATVDSLGSDVLFALDGALVLGPRNSDDLFIWRWDSRKHRMKPVKLDD
ncbi:MAG: hypothetical protein ABIQ41_04090 [Gemmatimonadales bacterium]